MLLLEPGFSCLMPLIFRDKMPNLSCLWLLPRMSTVVIVDLYFVLMVLKMIFELLYNFRAE